MTAEKCWTNFAEHRPQSVNTVHVQCTVWMVSANKITSNSISRHFFFQNNKPTIFSALFCYLPLPQVPVCYLFKLAVNWVVYSQHTRVCRCLWVCVCMYLLTVVLPDNNLHCINSSVIIIIIKIEHILSNDMTSEQMCSTYVTQLAIKSMHFALPLSKSRQSHLHMTRGDHLRRWVFSWSPVTVPYIFSPCFCSVCKWKHTHQ